MQQFLSILGWLLSPTRKIIDRRKVRDGTKAYRGNALRRWSFWFFCFDATACSVLLYVADGPTSTNVGFIGGVALLYACSRINEITYAFYRDPLSESKESDLDASDRIRMAMRSYFGLAFNFAVLYYFLPIKNLFKVGDTDHLCSFLESFYFSGVTLATLGYGDVTPVHWVSRLLALCEVFAGILILAVAVASYIGGMKEKGTKDA